MDLTGINNQNEYYTNHYLNVLFEDSAADRVKEWTARAKEATEFRTPWSQLRLSARQYFAAHDRYIRAPGSIRTLSSICSLADGYLRALGFPEAKPAMIPVEDISVPVYLEMVRSNKAPLLWVLLAASSDPDLGVLESSLFSPPDENTESYRESLTKSTAEDLINAIFYKNIEPPRFLLIIGMDQIALIDRNKWDKKRYLEFDLGEIFGRMENSTLQAMSVLLHRESLCPEDGRIYLDELDAQSEKNATGVSQDLKYALRESIELLGNEVLYDLSTRMGRNLETDPVDAGQLTLECMRFMYRMLFVLFIESRKELGYAPIQDLTYASGYSLESLRDIADSIREEVEDVGNGYYLHETLSRLFALIYNGYPENEEFWKKVSEAESLHDIFSIAPLKAHIFDPEFTPMLTSARLRNSCLLRIIDLMSLTRPSDRKNSHRQRISYANLGINQMGSVYEALLSYRGFIAQEDLYEVKRAGASFNELDVGYFVPERELDQYTDEERVRLPPGKREDPLRMYPKGTFVYRLAGREREKSASYYTPESLTKCLVKYALMDLLKDKTADQILELTICEPAMGSAAFLNEAINQLADAYLSRKEQESDTPISYSERPVELQKVKMYIADRNVYGIDLNPVAVELAEVSLWLNTIYQNAYVPWFGMQLVCGNSLIGARRQCYPESALASNTKGARWFEMAPDRVPLGTARKAKRGYAQIYHFLLGDPGMCNYTDKVIQKLEPENIRTMKDWNKEFNAPYNEAALSSLRHLSEVVDSLWERQIELRRKVRQETRDSLSIYGHTDEGGDSQTTIREKDRIYAEQYRSEHARNAGPYARLKFAMDYWCALWFWPIASADLLPSRDEFLNDMELILVGTFELNYFGNEYQTSMQGFETPMEAMQEVIHDHYSSEGTVDLDKLCMLFPRLRLASEIAEQQHFLHWELEFADIFQDRGGFDLILGNPPWIKISWNEKAAISDKQPIFAIKDISASDTAKRRSDALKDVNAYRQYLEEYQFTAGQQNFLSALQNYPELKGVQTNVYKCFLPQSWTFGAEKSVSAFVHPNGVFDDPKGGVLRSNIYRHLHKHFHFINELRLFAEVHHNTEFSINVYHNSKNIGFDSVCNLFDPISLDDCYIEYPQHQLMGIKDDNGCWNVYGHPDRVVRVSKNELSLFSLLLDGGLDWMAARLPAIHTRQLMEVLKVISSQKKTLEVLGDEVYSTECWHEANCQRDGTIAKNVHLPLDTFDWVLSGPHEFVANPLYKCVNREYKNNSSYQCIDLTIIPDNYRSRCQYQPACARELYYQRIPTTGWGDKITQYFRITLRKMISSTLERTLVASVFPPGSAHINGLFSLVFKHNVGLISGLMASLPYDFYVKITGKSNVGFDVLSPLPIVGEGPIKSEITARALRLNCLTTDYAPLWSKEYEDCFPSLTWAKKDPRLSSEIWSSLTSQWVRGTALRTDYERREALVELDVLASIALGMTLDQLKTIYRIQFPVLRSYEADTWYDINGRIVFSNNRGLTDVGFDRKTWEYEVKGAPDGKIFTRTILDDTLPGGPVERTIEYVAPFVRCDREQDYETAWQFFERKYGKTGLKQKKA